LDGYPKGWVAVWLLDDAQKIEYLPRFSELLSRDFDVAMVDMPIGLPESDYRACDNQARALLRPNQTRVFLGARRCFLNCASHADANKKAKMTDGKGVSAQLFGIAEKLNQLDAAMTPQLQARVFECHPELVFWRLNDRKPVPRKKDMAGIELRKTLLKQQGFDQLDELIPTRLGKGARIDDVLDACACAIAARDKGINRPLGGERDGKGLRMEIHY
jgi:predicted RNase H-like nuclease